MIKICAINNEGTESWSENIECYSLIKELNLELYDNDLLTTRGPPIEIRNKMRTETLGVEYAGIQDQD